jgi:hypothetical protein
MLVEQRFSPIVEVNEKQGVAQLVEHGIKNFPTEQTP